MRLLHAASDPAKSGPKYTVRTRCPQCGRKHITVFRVRHVSDSFFLQLGHFFRYARHVDPELGATSEMEPVLRCAGRPIFYELRTSRAI